MSVFQIIAIAAACFCLCGLFLHFIHIVRLGKPNDLSEKSGDTTKGIVYANTTAMLPQNKESAYLHLPGYAAGMLFHIGIFTSFLVFLLSFFPFFNRWIEVSTLRLIIAAVLAVTCLSGYILLFRRVLSKDLKGLSTPDDFISNALTSTFQLFTILHLVWPTNGVVTALYYIACSLLFVYMPFGKLRHAVYYFAARYHLGFFYGWRNVWPKHED
ncbi:MAG: hypothetical protein II865_09715 [Bacteroidales bacterium]|nr:hypothetical protein [Bacteroidales bacterium]